MFKLFAFLFLFATSFNSLSHAQETTKQFKTWSSNCLNTESGQKNCYILTQVTTQNGQELLRILGLFPGSATEGILQIRTPLGTSLKAGMVLKVGQEGRENSIFFNVCGPDGCVADITLNQNNLLKLRTSDQLEIRFVYEKPVTIPIPLSGMDDALKSIQR